MSRIKYDPIKGRTPGPKIRPIKSAPAPCSAGDRKSKPEPRMRWVVAVAFDGEETATEYPAGDSKDTAYRQAQILCDVLRKRGSSAVVAVAEVEERRVTVMELSTHPQNSSLTEPESELRAKETKP